MDGHWKRKKPARGKGRCGRIRKRSKDKERRKIRNASGKDHAESKRGRKEERGGDGSQQERDGKGGRKKGQRRRRIHSSSAFLLSPLLLLILLLFLLLLLPFLFLRPSPPSKSPPQSEHARAVRLNTKVRTQPSGHTNAPMATSRRCPVCATATLGPAWGPAEPAMQGRW